MSVADLPVPPPARGLAVPDPLGGRTPRGGAVAFLLDALRLRPSGRRLLTAVSLGCVLGAVALALYPVATDRYALSVVQKALAEQLASPAYAQAYAPAAVATGDALTRIVVPRLGVSSIVVQGTSPEALRAGAGHYPSTPYPGEPGNVGIAGHRTTYGRPFSALDEVQVGDEVRLETPLGVHRYEVLPPPPGTSGCGGGACWVTRPDDWSVVGPTAEPLLTLTTCHPRGSARQRLIVRARLVESLPPAPLPAA